MAMKWKIKPKVGPVRQELATIALYVCGMNHTIKQPEQHSKSVILGMTRRPWLNGWSWLEHPWS
jgi:hypothetical protein